MTRPATEAQARALEAIKANGGEAIKSGWEFIAGGKHVCAKTTMEIMARKGLVRIEQVGLSVFAVPRS